MVVARRYRPQTFAELVGQEHVAQALSNAIATNRVGHAYLFTGARGVGKTSAARILAKALNCVTGPTAVPCNRCEICQGVSSGEDVDALEIDGASNRGIDEIRQLRQNVNIRPSRARFKIYIIDEVHMLTREAFNALLKTLEEPPEHVKFIFCTTEPTKIPVTILSRCQRFDFAGIQTEAIARRLQQIVQSEAVQADPEALELLARRAAGSMRDSQSLLEQVLSFAPGRITVADVHGLLGTAGDQRLTALLSHLVDRNAAAALEELDSVLAEGVDVALLLEQLFGYFRDCMLAAVGCPSGCFLYASPTHGEAVAAAGKRLGLSTILAAMQILDQALSRLRYSTQGRIVAELALVRICQLEELDELAGLLAQLHSGVGPAPAAARSAQGPPTASGGPPPKKADERTGSHPAGAAASADASRPSVELLPEKAAEIWTAASQRLSGMVVEQAKLFERATFCPPNRLVITFKPGYALARAYCQRPEQFGRLEQALAEVTGQPVRLELQLQQAEATAAAEVPAPRPVSPQRRLLEVSKHPMIQRASHLFGAQPLRVDDASNRE